MNKSFLIRMLADILLTKGFLPTAAYRYASTIIAAIPDDITGNMTMLKSEIKDISDAMIGLNNKIGENSYEQIIQD